VLLNKLESGFLLIQTQRGLVAVEPSFWQRVYLLWTFRNFRQLSLPLLNPRQIALINNLFLEHAPVVSHEFEPSLEIGVIENFVPPAIEIAATLAARTDPSPAVIAQPPELTATQYFAPPVMPIAAAPAIEADVPPAVKKESAEKEGTGIDRVEFAPSNALDRSFAPRFPWLRLAWSNLAASKPAASRPQVSRIVIYSFAAAIGALSLCVCFIVASHRIGAVPGSHAHRSPPQLNPPDSPSAPEPTPVAEDPATVPEATPVAEDPATDDPATVPEATPQAGDAPDIAVKPSPAKVASSTPTTTTPQAGDAPDIAVKPSPAKLASPITATHPMTTPERPSRGATARVASRSSGGSHAAAPSRVPPSTSAGRMTLAPGSRGAMARSAQSYFDLANQQMHQGNYAAAAANYKRAWRIEENNAAAKGRLVRARRTMQAEKESIANRR
jgi:hypothetical protein